MESNSLNQAGPQSFSHSELIQLYDDLSPRLFRYAYRQLGDADLAEECVAETFSRFLQALKSGGGPANNAKGYLYRAAHNWVTDYYRSRVPESELEAGWVDDPNLSPSAILNRTQEQERVRGALMALTGEQRQVILLRFYEQWPHEEIGALIGKTAEATRALQYRALTALRRILIGMDEQL